MNKKPARFFVFAFVIILIADIVMIVMEQQNARTITKPLIAISLLLYFIFSTRGIQSPIKKWIIFALALSCLGDTFLLYEKDNADNFMRGLVCFLLAHLAYIVCFHIIRVTEVVRGRAWLLLPVAIYYAFIITLLSPSLGNMNTPVKIYAVVISFMLMLALHMLFIKNKTAGWMLAGGAFLFLVSDSLLAIEKFYDPFPFAPVLIMLTYGLAQLFITEGAVNYLKNDKPIVDAN